MRLEVKEENGDVRFVGTLIDRVFRRDVKESKHVYRKLDAWGMDAELFTDVLKGQADMISFHDTETNTYYMTVPEAFDRRGQFYHFKPHRAQIFLPRRYWVKFVKELTVGEIKELYEQAKRNQAPKNYQS